MRIRYGWELALAALLVIEIVAFGAGARDIQQREYRQIRFLMCIT